MELLTRRNLVRLVVAVAVLVIVVFFLAPTLVDVTGMAPAEREKARNDTRTVAIQFIGAIGLAAGAYLTSRTFGLNRQGQLTERFTKAIEQLGNSEALDVRLGGIYALERIARESPEDHGPIMEVLTAFTRNRSLGPDHPGPPPTDVQAALTVLARRRTENDRTPLDLAGVNLRRARLEGGALGVPGSLWKPVDMAGALLDGADLGTIDLTGVSLARAHLHGASLVADGADLTGARGAGASLAGRGRLWPKLFMAELQGALLNSLDLSGIGEPLQVDLSGATLANVDMSRRTFVLASLAGASLNNVALRGASLRRTVLRGARLINVDLTDATGLDEADLRGLTFDPETIWPAGFDPTQHGAAPWGEAIPWEAEEWLIGGGLEDPAVVHPPGSHHVVAPEYYGRYRADLRGVRVEDRSLVTIDLRQMDLRGAVLGPVSLNAAALQGADLRGARLVGVELEGAHLGHADLRGADLTSCDFHEADVTGADFRGAWLPADRMDPTGLGEALFAGAHYRSTTEWPAGFDPDAAGAVLDA